MIKINHLNKYFNKGKSNEIHVINDTCLEFEDTGLVCILGESGSGKTTLLNTIGGLDTFHNGNITIGDTTLKKYSPNEMEKLRNSKFGYVFQEKYLLQDQTVAYNIRLALNMFELSDAEKDERVDYVLQAVDMKKYKKRLVSQLSGGQQQRIAIARALVKTPDIIFADEPTGNLDEANTMRIMSIIKKISKECLVILVTHEKRIAEFFADRIIRIQDGKVVKDVKHESMNTYQYNDDSNLYLKEFEKESYDNQGIDIHIYNNGNKNKLTLNVVCINDKFYIQTPDEAKVVYLTTGMETQMVDDVKPIMDMEQIEDFDYSLSRLESGKKSKLSFKEILKPAKDNVKMLGKRQAFMIVSFLITSALLVIALADYLTTSSIDKTLIITQDSHYVTVDAKMSTSTNKSDFENSFYSIYQTFSNTDMAKDVYTYVDTKLSFSYQGIEQIQEMTYTFEDFSYVTLEHFNTEDLTYGRMPVKSNEVIINQWLIDKFYKSDSILKQLFTKPEDFLNLELGYKEEKAPLVIVGICDLEEPTIYLDKYMGASLGFKDNSIGSLQQLQAAYPGEYDDVTLGANEVLVPECQFNNANNIASSVFQDPQSNLYYYIAPNSYIYTVMGTYPDDFGVDSLIDDRYYKEFLSNLIVTTGTFQIYTEESEHEKIINYFLENQDGFDKTFVKLEAKDIYQEELTAFKKAREFYMNARFIVTIAIFTVSMLMLFFTMKSNAVKRMQEISVYRLMGITKGSILQSFIIEIVMVTSGTVLPVVLILSSLLKFIAGIPSLQANLVYPWSAVALLLLFLYATNIIVGILPVYTLLKLPPAQMTERL